MDKISQIKKEKDFDLEVQKKTFSVIIPCYNLGNFLIKAINSVFLQTLKNVEIIVVDDNSSDEKTKEILNKINNKVNLIRLNKNSGVSVARNEGIKLAQSNHILCLDADDTIEPTYLEKAKNIFDADKEIGLVSCYTQFFGGSRFLWKPKENLDIKDFLINSSVPTATCFRKNFHEISGGYDSNLRGYEDWDHWISIVKQGCKVKVIPEVLFNYYVRSNSKVATSNKNCKQLVFTIVNNHRELFEKNVDFVVAQKHYELMMCNRSFFSKAKSKVLNLFKK